MATKRLNFSVLERDILLRLIEEHIEIVESKKNDGLTVRRKDDVWAEIVARFNAEPEVVRRTHRQLRKYWNNLKMRAKKSASSSGPGDRGGDGGGGRGGGGGGGGGRGGGMRRRGGSGSYTVKLPTATGISNQQHQQRPPHRHHLYGRPRASPGPAASGQDRAGGLLDAEGRPVVMMVSSTALASGASSRDPAGAIKEEPDVSSPPPPPLLLAERLVDGGDAAHQSGGGGGVSGNHIGPRPHHHPHHRLYRHHQPALHGHRTAVPVALTAPPCFVDDDGDDEDADGGGDGGAAGGPDSEAEPRYSDDDNRDDGGGAMDAEDGGDEDLGPPGEDGIIIDSDVDEIEEHFNGVDDKEYGHETAAGVLGAADGCCVGGQWTALDLARREHEAKMALLTVQMETAHEQRELAREVRQQTRQRHRLEMQVLEEKRRYRRRKLNNLGPHHGPS